MGGEFYRRPFDVAEPALETSPSGTGLELSLFDLRYADFPEAGPFLVRFAEGRDAMPPLQFSVFCQAFAHFCHFPEFVALLRPPLLAALSEIAAPMRDICEVYMAPQALAELPSIPTAFGFDVIENKDKSAALICPQ
jgi:hypothetical protein